MPVIAYDLLLPYPPGRAFRALLEAPAKLSAAWPALRLVTSERHTFRFVGTHAAYSYLLMGMRIKGEYEIVRFVPGRGLLIRTLSGIDAALDLHLEPHPQGTHLALTVTFLLPGALLGGSTHRPGLEAAIEQDVDKMVQALMARFAVTDDSLRQTAHNEQLREKS